MIIENIKSGKKFDATKAEYDRIVETGNAYKYKVTEGDAPLEVKVMRSKVLETKEIKTKK